MFCFHFLLFQQDLFCHISLVSFTSVYYLFSFHQLQFHHDLLPTNEKNIRFCIRSVPSFLPSVAVVTACSLFPFHFPITPLHLSFHLLFLPSFSYSSLSLLSLVFVIYLYIKKIKTSISQSPLVAFLYHAVPRGYPHQLHEAVRWRRS